MTPEILVSAVLITDTSGRALVVRKNGTTTFMQPGGKPEPGESAAEAAVRELNEELGIETTVDDLRPLGRHRAAAANEPGHTVVADAFALTIDPAGVSPRAEIAEALWITPDTDVPLAPLSTQALLPLVWPRR
ncbi:MAG: NUDIX domain-containing protein [Microbacterium sp.]|jgi:8-oxo-dGTP pyrophosphatase MutT (NUDIX family)|nr:NUDIX domain-containing protein [Microbacterium sp.]